MLDVLSQRSATYPSAHPSKFCASQALAWCRYLYLVSVVRRCNSCFVLEPVHSGSLRSHTIYVSTNVREHLFFRSYLSTELKNCYGTTAISTCCVAYRMYVPCVCTRDIIVACRQCAHSDTAIRKHEKISDSWQARKLIAILLHFATKTCVFVVCQYWLLIFYV